MTITLFDLVFDLNETNLSNPENPVATSMHWIFTYVTNHVETQIRLGDQVVFDDNGEEDYSRKEILIAMKDELEDWKSALESVLWTVHTEIERADAVKESEGQMTN